MYYIYIYIYVYIYIYLLEMCLVSTNGERASPAQQGFQLIAVIFLTPLISMPKQVKCLPEYQELVHISVH